MGAIAAFAKLAPVVAPQWLAPVHKSGQAVWRGSLWPGRKTESWRYTKLKALETGNYLAQVGTLEGVEPAALARLYQIEGLSGERLVFINGCFCAALSSFDAKTLTMTPFSQANAEQKDVILAHMGSVIDTEQHLFAALNNQLVSEGALIHLRAGQAHAEPLHVVNIATPRESNFNAQPRLLVVAQEQSEASIIEHFVSTDEPQNGFVNNITELYLARSARVNHYRLNQEHGSMLHIGAVHAKLSERASLDSFYMATGGELKRLDVVVDYFGEHAESRINGVYLPVGNQQVDFHTCLEHRVARCTSSETFRGIISDNAKAVFNGRIHIHRDAQKTEARLNNKNLLTSDRAEVNTKPELEIYADDVQCAHGATVAELDAGSLYYLRARGIALQDAKVMLSFGFINELFNTIQLKPLADHLRPQLVHLFGQGSQLARYLR